jgi:hypothetical protein
VEHGDDEHALRAIDLGMTLRVPLYSIGHEGVLERELNSYWEGVEKKISERVDARLETFAPQNFLAFMHWFQRHDRPFEKLFQWYTPDHLFLGQSHVVFENVSWVPIIASVLHRSTTLGIPSEQQTANLIENLSKEAAAIGQLLLCREMPCFSYAAISKSFMMHMRLIFDSPPAKPPRREEELLMEVPIIGDTVIGLWCLWAAVAEVVEKQEELVSKLRETKIPVNNIIADVIEARMRRADREKVLRDLAMFNPQPNALEFVGRWITGQVSFVAPQKA